ncbi:hypothetical protein [Desulfurobacterium sp.]
MKKEKMIVSLIFLLLYTIYPAFSFAKDNRMQELMEPVVVFARVISVKPFKIKVIGGRLMGETLILNGVVKNKASMRSFNNGDYLVCLISNTQVECKLAGVKK